jgi:hypothetical protein
MTTTHLILRYAHISMAAVALVAGAASMVFRKGSSPHRLAGNAFFVSMLIMSSAGATIAIFITPVAANVMGGLTAFYLTATAWATVWRDPGKTGRLEIALALLGLATAVTGINFGIQAATSPDGMLDKFPFQGYFVFASASLIGAVLDVRMIRRGGVSGVPRLTRHLSRMCLAFFMATGSFFLGQPKFVPAILKETRLNLVLGLLPFALLLYWLVRVRIWPSIRKAWATRKERGASVGQSAPEAAR